MTDKYYYCIPREAMDICVLEKTNFDTYVHGHISINIIIAWSYISKGAV